MPVIPERTCKSPSLGRGVDVPIDVGLSFPNSAGGNESVALAHGMTRFEMELNPSCNIKFLGGGILSVQL